MATRRKKIVIAATSMLILLSMVGYSNADAEEDKALAVKYCGGATAMIVTEIGIEGKEDNENFRCWAKTDIKKPDLMSEEEFCSYVMPLAFDKYKDGKCYFTPLVNCDPATTYSTFAYYSLCVRILETKDTFLNHDVKCKSWGGELLKVPARNLRKWVYRHHKDSFWTSLEEDSKESLVLYTYDNIGNPDILPGSLVKSVKSTGKMQKRVKNPDGSEYTVEVVVGELHGGICTKPGALTYAGRKDKLELYSAIHPNSYGGPNEAKIFVSTGVYVPRMGSTTNEFTKQYGQFDYTFYQDICALVPDVGKLRSQIGIPHNDLKERLEKVINEGKWGMLGTTATRADHTASCDKNREWKKDGFGFQSIYGKKPYTVDGSLWGKNGDKIKECSDMPDTALVVTENGLLARAPFVRTHVFCYVGEPLTFQGLAREERCDKKATYDTIANACKCKEGYKDRDDKRDKGTVCDLCPIKDSSQKAPSFFITFDHKRVKKEDITSVLKALSKVKEHRHFAYHMLNYALGNARGYGPDATDLDQTFNKYINDYMKGDALHPSQILVYHHLQTMSEEKNLRPILIFINDGKVERFTEDMFGMTQKGKWARPESLLLKWRALRPDDGKFLFINVVDKNSDVAKMKKDWIAAGIARSEDEIFAVTDPSKIDDTLALHIVQYYCN